MSKQKGQNKKATEEKRITRRHAIYLIGAGAAAATTIFLGQSWFSNSPDYIFFPELHQITPVELAVDCAIKKRIKKVALEGLPRGKVSSSQYSEYERQYSAYRKDVDALDSRLVNIAPLDEFKKYCGLLGKNEILSAESVLALHKGMQLMSSNLLNAYAYNHDLKTVGNQFRYCKPFMDRDMEVHGLEDPKIYAQSLKEIYAQESVNIFYKNLTVFKTVLGMYSKNAKTPEDHDALKHISGLADRLDSIMREQGLRKEKIAYGDELIEEMKKKREISARIRSQIWLDYLEPFSGIMVIYGEGHTDLNVEIAKKQGKTYEIVKDGLCDGPDAADNQNEF